jgi:GT2 family glycosyltransferase
MGQSVRRTYLCHMCTSAPFDLRRDHRRPDVDVRDSIGLGGHIRPILVTAMSERRGGPDVSVVIACHTSRRWELLLRAIASARSQSYKPEQVVVVVDHNRELAGLLRAEMTEVLVVENELARGASGARNFGAAHTKTPLIAFLDDDATGCPEWLAHLVEPFSDPSVVGTGGAVAPDWEQSRPPWFPEEFAWVVGASYLGLPTKRGPIRNVWGENMAVRRSVFQQVGGFREGFGKLATVSRPEDTDLCLRMAQVAEGAHWVYVPDASVNHHVPVERTSFRFFLRRCYNEGRGKIELAVLMGGGDDLGSERDYVRRTVPEGIRRRVVTSIRQQKVEPLGSAGAMALGVGAAGVGACQAIARQLLIRSLGRPRRGVAGP